MTQLDECRRAIATILFGFGTMVFSPVVESPRGVAGLYGKTVLYLSLLEDLNVTDQ